VPDRLQVAARLHAGSNDAEHARVRPGQMFDGHRGDRGGPRFGDVPAVDDGDERAVA
jgi:hypothetical protein